jgi:Fe-S-cluster-containing dehydrogenase component
MALVRESNCVGCEVCTSNCAYYYNDETEYYECDGCGETDTTLYHDGDKHYCAECLAKVYKEDFIQCYWDKIVEYFADDFAEGFDVVEEE